jgi:hypothetical protein
MSLNFNVCFAVTHGRMTWSSAPGSCVLQMVPCFAAESSSSKFPNASNPCASRSRFSFHSCHIPETRMSIQRAPSGR